MQEQIQQETKQIPIDQFMNQWDIDAQLADVKRTAVDVYRHMKEQIESLTNENQALKLEIKELKKNEPSE